MDLSIIISAIELGCIFAILSLGLFIAFRILDLPDLTVDGSFVTGVAISAVMVEQFHPVLGILLAILLGFVAGVVTGLIYTKLHVHPILAGILTMTALYSINLKIMSNRPSIFFYGEKTIFSYLSSNNYGNLILLVLVVVCLVVLMNLFFKSQFGLSLIATGDNEEMVRASSIDTDFMKIMGFGLCNAIVALAGAIYAQYTSTANHSIGVGMLVLALASIIIGETLIGKKNITRKLIACVVGAIVYRLIITLAFNLGLPVNDLKLFSALIVIIAISLPIVQQKYFRGTKYVRNK